MGGYRSSYSQLEVVVWSYTRTSSTDMVPIDADYYLLMQNAGDEQSALGHAATRNVESKVANQTVDFIRVGYGDVVSYYNVHVEVRY